MITPNNFPLNRYKHCYGVGKRMYAYAKYMWHWDEKRCCEMFVLGNLHDIGYELDPDAFDHDWILASILDGSYKYVNEIRYHSAYQTDYDSIELRLLYFADMTVDGAGNWCNLKERLQDLEKRHGKNSAVYKESLELAYKIKEWGFDDKVYANQVEETLNLSEILKRK